LSVRRADDQLVPLEDAHGRRVGAHELRGLGDDLLEDRLWVEPAGEERPGLGELLRDRAVSPLAFEELRSFERSPCRSRKMVGQLDLVVRERLLLGEEDEADPRLFTARRLDGDGDE
jgi:hypothetical protein